MHPRRWRRLIAPSLAYATAAKMADAKTATQNFNVSWRLDVDSDFDHLVRLHFCDIISKALNDLYFNVYINGKMAVFGLDLSTLTGDIAAAYYKDFVVDSDTDQISLQIGPFNQDTGSVDALLNGVEVLKINN